MPAGVGDAEEVVRIISPDLFRVFEATRAADKVLFKSLVLRLKQIAEPMLASVRQEIQQIPSSGKYKTGIRQGLVAGTRVSVLSARERSAGIRIVTTGAKLDPTKRPLVKALNKSQFRRLNFAGEWVDQQGHPYFGEVLGGYWPEAQKQIKQAMEDTMAVISGEAE